MAIQAKFEHLKRSFPHQPFIFCATKDKIKHLKQCLGFGHWCFLIFWNYSNCYSWSMLGWGAASGRGRLLLLWVPRVLCPQRSTPTKQCCGVWYLKIPFRVSLDGGAPRKPGGHLPHSRHSCHWKRNWRVRALNQRQCLKDKLKKTIENRPLS